MSIHGTWVGALCWGTAGPIPTPLPVALFSSLQQPSQSRAASPPGPREVTAPAHLPGCGRPQGLG